VLVTAAPQGNGLLAVSLRAQLLPATPNNALRSLRVVGLNNAQVRHNGNLLQAGQEITLPPGTPDIALVLQRSAAGQPTTAQIVVIDACGEWPTLVGGGPNAF
jgi:hypothetical protein